MVAGKNPDIQKQASGLARGLTSEPSLSAFTLSFSSGFNSADSEGRASLQSLGVATTAFNPLARPGELVVIIARGEGGGLSGKLANKLAVEHFTEAILELGETDEADLSASEYGSGVHKPRAVTMLEAGFERANGQIYAFGHKLAAGGSLSTSILAIAISDGELAAAKVGDGDVMLARGGECVWLFSAQNDPSQSAMHPRSASEKFDSTVLVGSHRQVPVDFLHLGIEPHDKIELRSVGPDLASLVPSNVLKPEDDIDIRWTISVGPQAVFLNSRM